MFVPSVVVMSVTQTQTIKFPKTVLLAQTSKSFLNAKNMKQQTKWQPRRESHDRGQYTVTHLSLVN